MKIDLGKPMNDMGSCGCSSDPEEAQEEKNEVYYPSIYLSSEDEEYSELRLGQEVTLTGVVVSKSENSRTNSESHSGAEVEVRSLEITGGKANNTLPNTEMDDDMAAIDEGLAEAAQTPTKTKK